MNNFIFFSLHFLANAFYIATWRAGMFLSQKETRSKLLISVSCAPCLKRMKYMWWRNTRKFHFLGALPSRFATGSFRMHRTHGCLPWQSGSATRSEKIHGSAWMARRFWKKSTEKANVYIIPRAARRTFINSCFNVGIKRQPSGQLLLLSSEFWLN